MKLRWWLSAPCSSSAPDAVGNPLLNAAAGCAVLQLGNGKVDITGRRHSAMSVLGRTAFSMTGSQFIAARWSSIPARPTPTALAQP